MVGHQPTLGEVASMIFLGEEGEAGIRKGAIWWFEARATGGKMNAVLKWRLNDERLAINPAMLPELIGSSAKRQASRSVSS